MLAEAILTATIYAGQLRGGKMANGEVYNPTKYIVAMNNRPLNSKVTVCHQNRCADAVVADRMASRYGRHARRVDLSPALARELGVKRRAKVIVRGP